MGEAIRDTPLAITFSAVPVTRKRHARKLETEEPPRAPWTAA